MTRLEVRMAARIASRVSAVVHSRWCTAVAIGIALAIAAGSWTAAPHAALLPLLAGLACWTVGNYVLVPLRWHRLSASGQNRRWHLRVYAEGEVLGLLSPAHAGTDLWRVHMLRTVGMDRPSAVVDVAADRLVGGIGILAVAILGGTTLPPLVVAVCVGGAALVLAAGLLLRRKRPALVALPRGRTLARAIVMSCFYQFCAIGLLVGAVAAVGHSVSLVDMLGVAGAAQVAALIPGVHGAGPKEGALAAGLVAVGVPLGAAVGAISLAATLAWVPALLLGGVSHLARRRSRTALA
jgi:uncharacterized membrane protein YbhN (UPF0104 family)